MTFRIELYTKANGRCPVIEYIRTQDEVFRAQFFKLLERVERYGMYGIRVDSIIRSGKNKIFEMIHDDLRVLFFYDEGRLIIVTSAFMKKTGKTPMSEKKQALRYQTEYFERKGMQGTRGQR